MANILIFENSSGMAHYTYKICNGLAGENRNDNLYYLTGSDFIYNKDLNQKVHLIKKLKCFDSSLPKGVFWIINRIFVVLQNLFLRHRIINKYNIDVLNIQFTVPVFDRLFIKLLKKRVKIVLTVHDVIPPVKSFYWSNKSLKSIYDSCHLLIVHSNENKKQLEEMFSIPSWKIKVIHHGVDTTFNRLDRDLCLKKLNIPNDDCRNMLFFGGIREQKGLDVLIRAINNIQTECRLIIAGAMPYGESFDKYEKLIEKQNRFIKRIEFIAPEDLDYYFGAADVVVNPYKYFYSQSGVFMESLKYRKPLIATDVSSFKSFINKYNIGFVVEPDDVNSLQEGIEKFLECTSDELQKFESRLEQAAFDNSWEQAAKLYHTVFVESCKL